MNMDSIEEKIQKIRDRAGDDESQHSMEDGLREAFIKYVADQDVFGKLSEMAKLVLTTNEIDFERWCA